MYSKIKNCGIASQKMISNILPNKDRRQKKPYVLIECFQEIPCDPCIKACPKGAIEIVDNINNIPQVDLDKCDGCGLCIALCPGLAIFAIDETKDDFAIPKIPHEFNPPQKK